MVVDESFVVAGSFARPTCPEVRGIEVDRAAGRELARSMKAEVERISAGSKRIEPG